MDKKLWLSIVAVAIGASLLVAAATAAPAKNQAPAKKGAKGGTYIVEFTTDVDYTDPALDYLSTGWEMMYAAACKLYNFPDKEAPAGSQLQPEVAAGLPVISNGGKTYTFKLKNTYKFSDGSAVTASSFVDAFNRNANPKLQSPSTPFMDVIAGAQAVVDGKASSISGVKAVNPTTLQINLTRAAPDLISRLTMPFFQAIPKSLASNADPNGVLTYSSCGPYYFSDRVANKSITLKRNPFYKGPRPANVDVIQVNVGNSLEVIQQNVDSGKSDYAAGGLPPTAWATLAQKYGVNKGRVYIKPLLSINYLAMNHDRPLFKNNPQLKKAINWAIDRRALINQAGYGAGKRNDQVLPPGLPGVKDLQIYPNNVTPGTIAQAKKLASGHTGSGKAILWTSNRGAAPLQAQIYQFNLKQIGLDVEVQQYARAVQIEKEGTRGADFDLTTEGWLADYADPFDFMNILLSGDSLHDANNNNIAYFNSAKYNKMMTDASKLTGTPRYNAYAKADLDMVKNDPPWAVRANATDRIFVSARSGGIVFQPIFAFDYATAFIK
jgi:ABC-type oligopeptide transport system substrate-binding subunit